MAVAYYGRMSLEPLLDGRILAALREVELRYHEPLTVEALARSAGLSRFHFSRLFREQVGLSPYRHIMETRLARAAELLRGGNHNVTDAAVAVGFSHLGRFARAFRARFGCTPGELVTNSPRSGRGVKTHTLDAVAV